MNEAQLVIMAAGLGSRYGGMKQIAPVDDAGHCILQYSIFDALRAGFSRVVVIIKPEMQAEFHRIIGQNVEERAELRYAFQKPDMLPGGFSVPQGRVKPWGTAHAVLCAKNQIDGPFAAINADDFYGRGAFSQIFAFLSSPHAQNEHAMVGYNVENTLTEYGSVARGVCKTENSFLKGIVEHTHIEPRTGGAAYTEDGGKTYTFIPAGTTVSMNMWGFQRGMMDEIENRFSVFLSENLPARPLTCEYYLPLIPNQLLEEGAATVRVLPTREKWFGVTYQQDMARVRAAIAHLIEIGEYPAALI